MIETTKTCTHCAHQWPATAEYFHQYTRKSKDGSKSWTFLGGMCRDCGRAKRRSNRAQNVNNARERQRMWTAKSRAVKGRPDRTEEHQKRRERKVIERGFPSLADWEEHQARLKTERGLKNQLAACSKAPPICWLWNKPGLTAAEKFKVRYHLDAEFRVTQIDKARRSKPRLKQATPPWVDPKQLASIYAARPDGHHVDHIVPIKGVTHDGRRVSGLNVPWNLRYLPSRENIRRSNRITPEELHQVELIAG